MEDHHTNCQELSELYRRLNELETQLIDKNRQIDRLKKLYDSAVRNMDNAGTFQSMLLNSVSDLVFFLNP